MSAQKLNDLMRGLLQQMQGELLQLFLTLSKKGGYFCKVLGFKAAPFGDVVVGGSGRLEGALSAEWLQLG
jgi:hypothetical protein